MKKKIISLCLVVCLLATAIVGVTLAYFTDTDAATNVMAIGSVKIKQIEQERDAQGNLVDFTQAKPALPAVGPIEWAEKPIAVGGSDEHKVFTPELKNVVDKFVFVRNTGRSNAYVRTIIAIEAPGYDANNLLHVNINDTDGVTMTDAWTGIKIDDTDYVYAVFTYTDALEPGKETPVSLAQVFLDKVTTNEDMVAFGETWEILALSQAVQAAGFDTAEAALNEAFGAVTGDKVAEWFAGSVATVAAPESGATRPAGYMPEGADVTVNGVTVIDNSDDSTNLRALYTGDGKKIEGDLSVIGCYLDGTYAMNVIGDDTGVLTVADTDLRGWVSYDGFTSASFTNCTFAENSNPELYNNIRPYSTVTFTDCAFDGTTFWLDKLPTDATVTFVNCTMNGDEITAASQITVTEGIENIDAIVIG